MGTLSNYPVTFFKQCREFNDSRASWHGIVLFPDWLIGEALKQGDLIKLLPEYEVAIKSHPSISQPFIPMSAIHHLILEQ